MCLGQVAMLVLIPVLVSQTSGTAPAFSDTIRIGKQIGRTIATGTEP